ncbi:MAG: RNA polymerase subunit sigma [Betaproteobacteria bacterium]|nr:MAG: RNA polymerase subunit sigma [Betaproteobacteria bacterium]
MLVPGRRAGFDRAVERYFGGLYRYAYWLCRNRWQAEDVVQESLLRAWRAWPALREERALRSWLFTIVHREHLRAAARAPRSENDGGAEEPGYHPDPGGTLDMEHALQALPDDSREALLLQVLGGFSCAEIARVLGASEGAVMTRLTRARQALRRQLGAADEATGTAREARKA